eukprot:Colp12_sorted_trinity150504_noHs@25885
MAPTRTMSTESVVNQTMNLSSHLKGDEVEELRKKLALLEGDRKAYYENSQFSIKRNKDLITTLRVDNKDLRNQIMKFLTSEKSKKHENPNLYIQNEIEKLETTVNTQRRKIDEILAQAQDYQLKLEKLDDEMKDLKMDETQLVESTDESACAKRVRQLENRLDKALIKYHESMTIRATYETIVRRLQEERLEFDNQLEVVEGAIKSKRKDLLSVEEMAKDASAARDIAKDELTKFEQWLAEDRKMREKELQEKKAQVKAVRESAEKIKEREKRVKQANFDDADRSKGHRPSEEEEQKISNIEDAFRKIKDATGVTDINEVVEKFETQEATRQQLVDLQRGNEETLTKLQEEKTKLYRVLEDLKYSGEIQSNSRRVIDDFERHVVESERKEREAQAHMQRLTAAMVDVRAAIQHFSSKLQVEVKVGEDLADTSCVAALEAAEESLIKMIAKIDEKKYTLPPVPAIYPKEKDHVGPVQDESVKHVLPPHNLRVRLPAAESDEIEYGDDDDEDGGAQEDEVPSRSSMKKQAAALIDQKTKKKTKKTKRAAKNSSS